jgi:hypothetical protein
MALKDGLRLLGSSARHLTSSGLLCKGLSTSAAGIFSPGFGVLPREECKDSAGMAGFIAIVEVVGAGIVEVDGFLDEAQP